VSANFLGRTKHVRIDENVVGLGRSEVKNTISIACSAGITIITNIITIIITTIK
jgi:hypothetical protein